MKYTDIQLTDKELWAQFKRLYETGDYDAASGLLDVGQLAKKSLTADALNELTSYLVQVENTNDSTFKQDKIPCQAEQPSQSVGEVWFEVAN